MNNLSQRIVGIVVLVAVLVVAMVWLWKQSNPATGDNLAAVGSLGGQEQPAGPVSLTVEDQFPGSIVFVSTVELPAGGWVVIQRDEAGTPGAILGAGYFEKGLLTGEVNLAAASVEGDRYVAVLYHDNGDLKFDVKTDWPYRDSNNLPVMSTFQVTRNLLEKKG